MLPTFCKWQDIITLTCIRLIWGIDPSMTQIVHQISVNPLGF